MKLSKQTLDHFRSKYAANITKETDSQILLHCINPNHVDKRRSAVLYKDSGLLVCPVCKKINIKELIKGIEYEYCESRTAKRERQLFTFPNHLRERGYFYDNDGGLVFASFQDGNCVGLHKRVKYQEDSRGANISGHRGRRYFFNGVSTFRGSAKYITESTTDAIRLIEAGIDAGSICSVSNVSKVKEGQIYVPQIDEVGIDAGLSAQRRGIMTIWWNNKFHKQDLVGVKDICDLDEAKFRKILSLFNVTP